MINSTEFDITKRLLLKEKIHQYIKNKVSLAELENSELFLANNEEEYKLFSDIFHAIHHFDADICKINNVEKTNMEQKLINIADSLTESNEYLRKAINIFFNDPYSRPPT